MRSSPPIQYMNLDNHRSDARQKAIFRDCRQLSSERYDSNRRSTYVGGIRELDARGDEHISAATSAEHICHACHACICMQLQFSDKSKEAGRTWSTAGCQYLMPMIFVSREPKQQDSCHHQHSARHLLGRLGSWPANKHSWSL